jgi:hypothetical protein
MAKTKYIMHHCAYCRRETKMEFVGNQPSNADNTETVKNWYRCNKCKHSALLTLPHANQTKKSHTIALNREQCTDYAKEKTFTVGEYIYYAEWDDMGKVIRKDKMSNGTHSIIVSFEKSGERKLLENLQPEPEEVVETQIL